jgi:hypothetical protein
MKLSDIAPTYAKHRPDRELLSVRLENYPVLNGEPETDIVVTYESGENICRIPYGAILIALEIAC